MKVAVFADLHSNYLALERCLEYTKKEKINHYIFLGDYVGELPHAQKTMSILYDLQQTVCCYFIKGNREEYMLRHLHDKNNIWPDFNSASGCLLNTFEELTQKDFSFFEQLPDTLSVQIGCMPAILCCHGSPDQIGEYITFDTPRAYEILHKSSADYILYGHTHIQGMQQEQHKTLINPGSIGSPIESEDAYTQFAILHSEENLWKTEFVSLPYPLEKCIKELHESTLPKRAPVWCRLTEYCLRNGVAQKSTSVLNRAIELCTEREGKCIWPFIPECDWEQAAEEFEIPKIF